MKDDHRSYNPTFFLEKNSGLYEIRTLHLWDMGAALYRLGAGRWTGLL